MSDLLFCAECLADDDSLEFLTADNSVAYCRHRQLYVFTLGRVPHYGIASREQLEGGLLAQIRAMQLRFDLECEKRRN